MATKRVLMLSWEYPPRIIGGLARVVAELSNKIAQDNWEVHVITADHPNCPEYQVDKGVFVHRVKTQTDSCPDFLTWVSRLNFGMLQYAIELQRTTPFSIIHAHDWMVTDAAWVLKSGFGIPIVATIHATEAGRMHGIHNDLQRYIHQMEWRLTFESWEVIVNSKHMYGELQHLFSVPKDKIAIIPNGTDPDHFNFEFDQAAFRQNYVHPSERIILFVGRLVPEKGVQVLLNAAPQILSKIPNARILIVGDGYFAGDLKQQAHNLGIADKVNFLGYVSDQDLLKLYRSADVVAIPSLYEPFGIVALEGMAAKVPVVSADTGGLTDFVEHMQTGVTTYAGDAGSLAWGVTEVLTNQQLYEKLSRDAYEKVSNIYNWKVIAKRTLEVYEKVLKEAAQIGVEGVAARPKQPLTKTASTTQPFASMQAERS
jgi:glycosyltransferase involved in cell wall biosynthesis